MSYLGEKEALFATDMKRIHPEWSDKDIRWAFQRMPTSTAYAHTPGSVAFVAEREEHAKRLAEFVAYVMEPSNPPFPYPDMRSVSERRAAGEDVEAYNGSDDTPQPSNDALAGVRQKAKAVGGMVKEGSKKARCAALIQREGGASIEEICEALGVEAGAARGLIGDCRKAGVKIKREGERYTVG